MKKIIIYQKKKNNIILIKFDDLLLKTKEVVKKISEKFNLKLSGNVSQAMREQNCPRYLDYKNRLRTKKRILKNLSPKFKDIFKKMIYQYENNSKVF